jgi:hypothetical protein
MTLLFFGWVRKSSQMVKGAPAMVLLLDMRQILMPTQ